MKYKVITDGFRVHVIDTATYEPRITFPITTVPRIYFSTLYLEDPAWKRAHRAAERMNNDHR